jgi:hypothetical protein
MKNRTLFSRLAFLLLAAVIPLQAGCSSEWERSNMGIIWGKVNIKEQPLTGGTIHFVQGDKKTTLWIRGDGTYSGEVPVGPAKVAIETDTVKYRDREKLLEKWQETVGPEILEKKQQERITPGMTAAKLIYVEIPPKYNDPEKSGLSHDVIQGKQERDFNLD